MVATGSGNNFVKLKDSLVEFLTRLNTERRNDLTSDKIFVKGLLIAAFSVETIKEQRNLETNLLEFIKGNKLFVAKKSDCSKHTYYFNFHFAL